MLKPLSDLIAEIEALRAHQVLKRQLVRVEQWEGGRQISVPHVLVPGVGLVKLTDQQIADLEAT